MDDAEIDIELREPRDVAARVIILATVLRRLALEHADDADNATGEVFDLREWLRDQQLTSEATPRELALFDRPLRSLTADEIAEWSWQGAGLTSLAWALGLRDLPEIDSPVNVADVLAGIPAPWEATASWMQDANIAPEATIAAERERAEIWHWRATTEALRRAASPAERGAYEAALAEVATEAAAAGLVPTLIGGDFPIGRLSIRDLPANALEDLLVSSAERLRALNWLSGFGATWDEVPLHD